MPRVPRIQTRSERGRNTYYTINFQGKRHYLGADFAVAHERAAEILGRIPASGSAPLTVHRLVELWLEEHPKFRNPEWPMAWAKFENKPLVSLGTDCLVRFDKYLKSERHPIRREGRPIEYRSLSVWTRRHYVAYAARVCKWAVKNQWMTEVPTKPTLPKAPANPVGIPIEQIQKTLDSVPKRAARIIRFALATGCRISEALQLRWEYFDRNGDRFILPPRAHKTGAKTAKSRRIFLPPMALEIIDQLTVQSSGFVFLNSLGRPYTLGGFRSTVRRHGISTPRKLRHSAAHSWLDQGVPLEDIAKLLGHGDLSMVKVYAEIRDERSAHVASKLVSPLPPASLPQEDARVARGSSSAKPRRSRRRTSASTRSTPKPKRATRKASRSRRLA